jgi:hypothetical protein
MKGCISVTGFREKYEDGVLLPNLTFIIDRVWFQLSRNVSAQNNRHWNSITLRETSKASLHKQITGVWCATVTSKLK